MAQSTADGPFSFGDFSLILNIDAFPRLLKHRPSGHIWCLKTEGELSAVVHDVLINSASDINAQSLKTEANHAYREILKQVREEQS
jgi:hypothetical protein